MQRNTSSAQMVEIPIPNVKKLKRAKTFGENQNGNTQPHTFIDIGFT